MANKEFFDIHEKSHRLISVKYGNFRLSLRSPEAVPQSPEETARGLIELTEQTPNGEQVLLEVAESSRDLSMRKTVKSKPTAHNTDMFEAAS